MNGVNRVFLAGHLGITPKLETTKNGKAYTRLRLATTKVRSSDSGEYSKETQWHSVMVWGKQAEASCLYLKKGAPVAVEAYLDSYTTEDQDGNNQWKLAVVAQQVHFLRSNNATQKEAG